VDREGMEFARRTEQAPMSGRLTVMALGLALVGGALVIKESFFWRRGMTSAPAPTLVQVEGEVPRPGWYELESATVHEALQAAGASTEGIDDHPVRSGRRIAVTSGTLEVGPSGQEILVGMPLDLNEAGVDSLVVLPGIGPTRADAIVQRRNQQGAFLSIEELLDVHGIGPKTLEKLRPFVHVGP